MRYLCRMDGRLFVSVFSKGFWFSRVVRCNGFLILLSHLKFPEF